MPQTVRNMPTINTTERRFSILLRTAGALVAAALLGACSTNSQQPLETAEPAAASTSLPPVSPALTAEALLARIDEAGAERFLCDLNGTTVARLGGYDSFYSSEVDDTGNGLSVVTIAGVSYARYQGLLDTSASTKRQSVVKMLNGKWATWGQPDTIMLEELPGSPSGCLAWYALDASSIGNVVVLADGTITFNVELGDGVSGTGSLTSRPDGTAERLTIGSIGSLVAVVSLGEIGNAGLPSSLGPDGRTRPRDAVDITQEEYFALVGG